MKKTIAALVALLPLLAFAPSLATYTFDLGENSSVQWTGKKVTGQHTGTIEIVDGYFKGTAMGLTEGMITMNMNSIACTDLKTGEGKEDLEGHLKSPDFFNVKEHKTATLKITGSELTPKVKETTHNIFAELTIKGITEKVTIPASLIVKESKTLGTAKLTFDRTKFDIKYNSGNFFSDLGDHMIYDDIVLDITIDAKAR